MIDNLLIADKHTVSERLGCPGDDIRRALIHNK